MDAPNPISGVLRFFRALAVAAGALVGALACFLVLPLLQAISAKAELDLTLVPMQAVDLPPPPPVEEDVEEEKKEEEKPPELDDEAPPLDLQQLELALSGGIGEGSIGGDFAVKIQGLGSGEDAIGQLFSLNDLDQRPRVIHNPGPVLTAALRKKMPANVTVLFVVDQNGRVENLVVQSSTDPAFEAAVLAAVKQWKFEPGKRGGNAVRSRMRQPFKFEG